MDEVGATGTICSGKSQLQRGCCTTDCSSNLDVAICMWMRHYAEIVLEREALWWWKAVYDRNCTKVEYNPRTVCFVSKINEVRFLLGGRGKCWREKREHHERRSDHQGASIHRSPTDQRDIPFERDSSIWRDLICTMYERTCKDVRFSSSGRVGHAVNEQVRLERGTEKTRSRSHGL